MTNKLELKHFDNFRFQMESRGYEKKLIHNGGEYFEHELRALDDLRVTNFVEFYVDGIPLFKHIMGEKRGIWFLSEYSGLLSVSSYNEKLANVLPYYEALFLLSLKRTKLEMDIAVKTILMYQRHKWQGKELLGDIIANMNAPKIMFYGCNLCCDYTCGRFMIEVAKDENFYYWKNINNVHNKNGLNFKFEKRQYESALDHYWNTTLKPKQRNKSILANQ